MPRDKDLKRLVRSRMAQTGERYTQAKGALTRRRTATSSGELRALVPLLGDPATATEAFKALRSAPKASLRRVTVPGLSDPNPRIRRACARLLDEVELNEESLRALTRALDDPEPRVRAAAFHALVCEGCKPDGCVADVPALAIRMLGDPNADVRRHVIASLWEPRWRRETALAARIELLARMDPSGYVRIEAQRFVDGMTLMRKVDARWRALDERSREKALKHAGKWVAIADGVVVSADRHVGQVRRDVRGKRLAEATIVYVPGKDEAG